MIQKLIAWAIGKKIMAATGEVDPYSKAKIAALLGILIPIIEPLSTALGHPIHVPDIIYKILGFAGLWAVRDALPPKNPA